MHTHQNFMYCEGMVIELNAQLEKIVREQLAAGNFNSVDEMLASALGRLPHRERSNRTAVARMLEFVRENTIKLPAGERVEDLVRDAHRY